MVGDSWNPIRADADLILISQVQPAELGYDQVFQLVYRDHRVLGTGRGRRLQLGLFGASRIHLERNLRLQAIARRFQGCYQELEQSHR
jgi:hypothetical protein